MSDDTQGVILLLLVVTSAGGGQMLLVLFTVSSYANDLAFHADVSGSGQGPLTGGDPIANSEASGYFEFRIESFADRDLTKSAPVFSLSMKGGPSTANFIESSDQANFAAQVVGVSREQANFSINLGWYPEFLQVSSIGLKLGVSPEFAFLQSKWSRTETVKTLDDSIEAVVETHTTSVGITAANVPLSFAWVAPFKQNQIYGIVDVTGSYRGLSSADEAALAHALGSTDAAGVIVPVQSTHFYGLALHAIVGLNDVAWFVRLGGFRGDAEDDVAGITNTYFIMGPTIRANFISTGDEDEHGAVDFQ